jgi:phosphoglycolate phosphatase-like HAD superfamily hydrolase
MSVEFISLINVNDSNELNRKQNPVVDHAFFRRYARVLEDGGFDYTLVPYSSAFHDPFTVAAALTQHTERIKPIVALRPNTVYPTVAAKALATLDQLSGGRAVVHFIAGGSDQEQAREGDRLTKAQRYARQAEYIEILRRSWTETEPFDHAGELLRRGASAAAMRTGRQEEAEAAFRHLLHRLDHVVALVAHVHDERGSRAGRRHPRRNLFHIDDPGMKLGSPNRKVFGRGIEGRAQWPVIPPLHSVQGGQQAAIGHVVDLQSVSACHGQVTAGVEDARGVEGSPRVDPHLAIA